MDYGSNNLGLSNHGSENLGLYLISTNMALNHNITNMALNHSMSRIKISCWKMKECLICTVKFAAA